MSISDWKKRWLYDSKVEIPKTTKWRRRCENINDSISDDICLGDVWKDLSSDTTELVNNTSLFIKGKVCEEGVHQTYRQILRPRLLNVAKENILMGTFACKLKMRKSWNCVYTVLSGGFCMCIFFVCLLSFMSCDNYYKTVFHSFKMDRN